MHAQSNYAINARDALANWLLGQEAALFDHLVYSLAPRNMQKDASGAAEQSDELTTKEVWLEVFKHHEAKDSSFVVERPLLIGLLENNRWRSLFDQEDTAYAFMFMLTRFFDFDAEIDGWAGAQVYAVWARLHAAVTGMISPDETPHTMTLRSVACAMFGDPWCSLVYDGRGASQKLADLIASERPPFLPGLITNSKIQMPETLPELGSLP